MFSKSSFGSIVSLARLGETMIMWTSTSEFAPAWTVAKRLRVSDVYRPTNEPLQGPQILRISYNLF
jgi:hypothetical protein